MWHAALQEYIFDKCVRRLNLSKTRTSKFSEVGQLFGKIESELEIEFEYEFLVWYALNSVWGGMLCYNFGFFARPSKLCEDWPHDLITWEAKLFYIFQVCLYYII